MPSDNRVYTIQELAEHLRVHPTTIYRLLRERKLPAFRVGTNWRFHAVAIEQWEQTQSSGSPMATARGRRGHR